MKLLASTLSACLALFSQYLLADEIYVAVDGSRQGRFAGDAQDPKLADKIQAIAFAHEIVSPTDTATGRVAGRAQHRPITITKPVGASSPQFFSALTAGEALKSVTIDFVGVNTAGQRILVYQIALKDAIVSRILQRMTEAGTQTPWAGRYVEEISFSYRTIQVTFSPTKRTASADSMAVR